jgi:hypothetical protein
MKMRLKKLGLAVVVVGVLGAIMASSAFATMETPTSPSIAEWYTGTTAAGVTTLTADKEVTLRSGKHAYEEAGEETTVARFKVKSGENLYELTATGIKCVACKITNGSVNAEKAMAKGQVEFTGVTVMSPEPTKCSVKENKVLTTALVAHADWMEKGIAEKAFVKFEPAAGTTTAFANVKIEGPECALGTTLVVKGFVFGEAINNTTVMAKEQPITFSKRVHETTESSINVNGNTALLEGRGIAETSPTVEFFGVK